MTPHALDGRVTTADGLDLYWRAWLPARPRTLLLFLHGLGEHSGRYATAAAYFVDRGYACYAADHRSHGQSPGRRVDVASFDSFLLDVETIRRLAVDRHPNTNVVL